MYDGLYSSRKTLLVPSDLIIYSVLIMLSTREVFFSEEQFLLFVPLIKALLFLDQKVKLKSSNAYMSFYFWLGLQTAFLLVYLVQMSIRFT